MGENQSKVRLNKMGRAALLSAVPNRILLHSMKDPGQKICKILQILRTAKPFRVPLFLFFFHCADSDLNPDEDFEAIGIPSLLSQTPHRVQCCRRSFPSPHTGDTRICFSAMPNRYFLRRRHQNLWTTIIGYPL